MRTARTLFFAVSPIALLSFATASSDTAETPAVPNNALTETLNLGFEAADHPKGWFAGGEGYAATVDAAEKHSGAQSLRITYEKPGNFGVATSTFPAPDLAEARGGRLRLSGHLKTDDVKAGGAGLWMRVDGPEGILAFDNMQRRSVTGTTDWTRYEVTLDVPEEATNINFGALLTGQGTIWVDSMDFEFLPPAEPPPVVTVRGIVRDREGQPVPGALVAVVQPLGRREAHARSGEDGRFAVEVAAGEYGITATAEGLAAAYQAPRALEAGQEQDLRMGGEGFTVSGRVTDDENAPVAGETVQLVRVSRDVADLFFAETDAEGRYAATLPPAESYQVFVDSRELLGKAHSIEGDVDRTVDLSVFRQGPAPGSVVEWIRANAIPLKTPEAGHGFDDMKPLRGVIGDARLVGLGEATHGSREFFQLKHRMLEFLVEEMGFTVFAIEANWPESLAVNEYVLHGKGDPREALAGMYFWTWNTEEVLALVEWMREYNADPAHETKLRFYGFDMQTPTVAVERVLEYVGKVDPEKLETTEASLASVRGRQSSQGMSDLPREDLDALETGIETLLGRFDANKKEFVARSSEREWVLARQHLVIVQQAVSSGAGGQSFALRDEAMAANVQWILDTEPPGTKVVAWAHNGHVSRFGYGGVGSMGTHLSGTLGDDYVVFGFAFNQGSFQAIDWTRGRGQPGRLDEHTVGPAPEVNVGAAFARAGTSVFALDLRPRPGGKPPPAWFSVPHSMRQIGAIFSGEDGMSSPIVLTEHYDAILFVEETTRAVPVKPAPPKAEEAGSI